MQRDIIFLFTGLEHRCKEFNLIEFPIINKLYKSFDIKCFPISKDLVENFEIIEKEKILSTINFEIENRPSSKYIILSHSYGCIISLIISQALFELGKKNIFLILIDPTASKQLLIKLGLNPIFISIYDTIFGKISFDFPTLLITFFNTKEIYNKISKINNINKLNNLKLTDQFLMLLNSHYNKLNILKEMIKNNPNVNFQILPVEPTSNYSENPHFIHINEPELLFDYINKFINFINSTYHIGGFKKSRKFKITKRKTLKRKSTIR
jgi:hypothetical protein